MRSVNCFPRPRASPRRAHRGASRVHPVCLIGGSCRSSRYWARAVLMSSPWSRDVVVDHPFSTVAPAANKYGLAAVGLDPLDCVASRFRALLPMLFLDAFLSPGSPQMGALGSSLVMRASGGDSLHSQMGTLASSQLIQTAHAGHLRRRRYHGIHSDLSWRRAPRISALRPRCSYMVHVGFQRVGSPLQRWRRPDVPDGMSVHHHCALGPVKRERGTPLWRMLILSLLSEVLARGGCLHFSGSSSVGGHAVRTLRACVPLLGPLGGLLALAQEHRDDPRVTSLPRGSQGSPRAVRCPCGSIVVFFWVIAP